MKSVGSLYSYLDKEIPKELSLSWDNDGLMVCSDPERECKRVLLALDVTREMVDYGVREGFDVIISHHPLIFKALKSVNTFSFVSEKVIKLIKNDVAVFSFHTRLDAFSGGVNDALAQRLGLEEIEAFGSEDEMIGRTGILANECSLADIIKKVKDALGCERLTCVDSGRMVKRVCLVGGDGKDFLKDAFLSGADLYITGAMSYNSMLDAADMGISVIEAGHFESENPVLEELEKMIKEFDGGIYIERFFSNPVITV